MTVPTEYMETMKSYDTSSCGLYKNSILSLRNTHQNRCKKHNICGGLWCLEIVVQGMAAKNKRYDLDTILTQSQSLNTYDPNKKTRKGVSNSLFS
jgi:hypothetical protein